MTPSWQPKDAAEYPDGLILFDGVCVLCSRSIQFVINHDRDGWFRFTPIQSRCGAALAGRLGVSTEGPETNAVIVRGRAYFKSDAVIQVLQRLPKLSWTRGLLLVPRRLRDFVYDRVAQNRYRLFGRTESCMVPRPDILARFVFEDAQSPGAPPSAAASVDRRSPFQVLLGDEFGRLPAPVRRVHALDRSLHTAGRAEVAAAPAILPQLLCRLAGLPRPGTDVPVTVAFHPDGHWREFWRRRFGSRQYASALRAGDPRAPSCLVEHFGPFALEFDLARRGEGVTCCLAWSLGGWRLCGVRLPRWTVPRIECRESADGERFIFDIDVAFPVVGHVVRYHGWLESHDGASRGGA